MAGPGQIPPTESGNGKRGSNVMESLIMLPETRLPSYRQGCLNVCEVPHTPVSPVAIIIYLDTPAD